MLCRGMSVMVLLNDTCNVGRQLCGESDGPALADGLKDTTQLDASSIWQYALPPYDRVVPYRKLVKKLAGHWVILLVYMNRFPIGQPGDKSMTTSQVTTSANSCPGRLLQSSLTGIWDTLRYCTEVLLEVFSDSRPTSRDSPTTFSAASELESQASTSLLRIEVVFLTASTQDDHPPKQKQR